jgi:hypothetical protein
LIGTKVTTIAFSTMHGRLVQPRTLSLVLSSPYRDAIGSVMASRAA